MANHEASSPSSSFANGIGKSFLDRRAVHRPNRHPCTSQLLCICCTRTAKTRRGPSSYSNRYASQRDYKPLQCTPSRRDVSILSHWSDRSRSGMQAPWCCLPTPAHILDASFAWRCQPLPPEQTRRRCFLSYLSSHTLQMHGTPCCPNRLVFHV